MSTMTARRAVQAAQDAAHLVIGQALRGRRGTYTLTKHLEECVWTATNEQEENVIIKSVRHWRLQNERDLLKRFQHRTPFLRPVIDEVEDPSGPPAIVLQWLDQDMLRASDDKRLTRKEVKQVAKGVLEALKVLHGDGYIHTDVKPSNILVNHGAGSVRFKDVKLADLGGTVHQDSVYAKEGHEMGTAIFRSPEAQLQITLGTPMDIWSFGATMISLIYGEGFHIFRPSVPHDHPCYNLDILIKHHRIFGPWPVSYAEIAGEDRLQVLTYTMEKSPRETLKTFRFTSEEEICKEDKDFISKIMKLDPRDRPTVQELLEDEWFHEDDGSHGCLSDKEEPPSGLHLAA